MLAWARALRRSAPTSSPDRRGASPVTSAGAGHPVSWSSGSDAHSAARATLLRMSRRISGRVCLGHEQTSCGEGAPRTSSSLGSTAGLPGGALAMKRHPRELVPPRIAHGGAPYCLARMTPPRHSYCQRLRPGRVCLPASAFLMPALSPPLFTPEEYHPCVISYRASDSVGWTAEPAWLNGLDRETTNCRSRFSEKRPASTWPGHLRVVAPQEHEGAAPRLGRAAPDPHSVRLRPDHAGRR